ncbi:unnamed protein product, partial [Ectocarpus sp. 8 AP-2014]
DKTENTTHSAHGHLLPSKQACHWAFQPCRTPATPPGCTRRKVSPPASPARWTRFRTPSSGGTTRTRTVTTTTAAAAEAARASRSSGASCTTLSRRATAPTARTRAAAAGPRPRTAARLA